MTQDTFMLIVTTGIFAPLLVVVKRVASAFIEAFSCKGAPTYSPHIPTISRTGASGTSVLIIKVEDVKSVIPHGESLSLCSFTLSLTAL